MPYLQVIPIIFVQVSVSFFIYLTQRSTQVIYMGCYLQADIYWKVSFVVLNTYKRKCQQTNIRLKWTIYYTTINNELFRFKRLMGFWTDITSLTSFASNSSLLLIFFAFDILLNSVFWSKNHAQNWKTNLNKL